MHTESADQYEQRQSLQRPHVLLIVRLERAKEKHAG
jgi:hypothetical protein